MPKLKTHKGAAKRFKKTATGKVKRGHAKLRHILTSKDKKNKRKLGKSALVSEGDRRKVLRTISYQCDHLVILLSVHWLIGSHNEVQIAQSPDRSIAQFRRVKRSAIHPYLQPP